eukprot:gene7436-5348_t
MQGSDSYLRSSLEDQIEEARRRAYSYANSLKGVREQDAHRVKSFEEERDRWTRTFEEKSVLIEQLERELKSAVDALDLQRLQSQQRPVNSTLILDDDQINSEFKRLLHVQSSPNRSSSSPNRKQAAMDTTRMASTNRSSASDVNQSSRFPAPPHFGDTMHSQTQLSFNATAVPPSHTTDVWNHLLEQYKEQLQRSREDITHLTREKKDLVQRLLDVTKELTLVADERDQMKRAMEDMDGKLQFRSAQVREYELERDRLLDVDGSKASTIDRLQHEVNSLRFQLTSMERESKVSIQTIAALQQEMQQQSVDANRTRYLDEIRQKDDELYRLRQQLNDKEHLVKQELAETKQLVRSLQLRLTHAESLNQVSHLEQRYDRSTRRTGHEAASLSPRASSSSSAAAALVRSPSHERLHGSETISSSLKRASSRENLLASSEGVDATLLHRSSSRDVTNGGSAAAATLGRSPSREKLSKSPSREQLTSMPTRSPSRVGSGLSIDTGVPPSHQHHHQQQHGHHSSSHTRHDPPPAARSLSKSPSKSKLPTTGHDASPSPRRSNSSVNFRDVEDVHVFSPDAAAHHHGHHHAHVVGRARSSKDTVKDAAKEAKVAAKKKTRKSHSGGGHDDVAATAAVAAKKKSRSSHSPVSPAISVTISPKKKPTAAAPAATTAAHAGHHSHSHSQPHHPTPAVSARGSASQASPPVLKSALKGRVLHVPGGPSPSHPPLPPSHALHASHVAHSSRSPVTPLPPAPPGGKTSTRSPSADRHVTPSSKTKTTSSTTPPSSTTTAMAARKAAATASSSSPSTAAATKKKATAAVVVMPDHHHRHHLHQQQPPPPPPHTQHASHASHGQPHGYDARDASRGGHRPSSAHRHHHHHDDDDGSHSAAAAAKKPSTKTSSTKKAKKLKRAPSSASIDERAGRPADRHRSGSGDRAHHAEDPRSRSASAHSRVSSVATAGGSSTVTSPIEHRPYMRPTSSFIGKIKDKDGNTVGRTGSQRDVLRSSTGGESIGSGGRDSDLSPTRRGVWVPAATAGATALLHPRLSRLSSAASAASFHLPTKSSLSKSAFVENVHLSR